MGHGWLDRESIGSERGVEKLTSPYHASCQDTTLIFTLFPQLSLCSLTQVRD